MGHLELALGSQQRGKAFVERVGGRLKPSAQGISPGSTRRPESRLQIPGRLASVSLKAIGFVLGSDKKNKAVAAIFPHLRDTIQYPFIYR
jgi:hypothetical protein